MKQLFLKETAKYFIANMYKIGNFSLPSEWIAVSWRQGEPRLRFMS